MSTEEIEQTTMSTEEALAALSEGFCPHCMGVLTPGDPAYGQSLPKDVGWCVPCNRVWSLEPCPDGAYLPVFSWPATLPFLPVVAGEQP